MKKLLLIRHAKAVHDTAYSDFERPLKHSGRQDAIIMAERLMSESIIPQLIVTSPSLRTAATADIVTGQLALPQAVENAEIYDAGQQTLLDIVSRFPEQQSFIGLVGHNPGINQLLEYYTGDSREMSPGSAAMIIFEVELWQMITFDSGKLVWFSSPKDQ